MKKRLVICMSILVLILLIFALLIFNGYVWFNNPSKSKYPIRGIDVSSYQGNINWQKVKLDGFNFVFIKATEGSDFKDRNFNKNWIGAKKAGFKVGAYHFFTFRSSGVTQAENFINNVPVDKDILPPVIDIEFGGNSKKFPNKTKLRKELNKFISIINEHYKIKPLLYVTYDSYNKYIIGDYKNYKIWIRDIFMTPTLKGNRKWSIWQYCNRGRVSGIKGFVDLDVFNERKIIGW